MKKVNKMLLGLVGATLLSAGLYACSSDDAATTPQTETMQSKAAVGSIEYYEIAPPVFGKVFDARTGGCYTAASGFCIGVPKPTPTFPDPGMPFDGIGIANNLEIRLMMSRDTYQQNRELFANNVYVIENEFLLAPEVMPQLGFSPATVIERQTAKVVKAEDRDGFYMDLKVRRN